MSGMDYTRFGLRYTAGRRVAHLSNGGTRTMCGITALQMPVRLDDDLHLCKRCPRTVKVIRVMGSRIAVFRIHGDVVSVSEVKDRKGAV